MPSTSTPGRVSLFTGQVLMVCSSPCRACRASSVGATATTKLGDPWSRSGTHRPAPCSASMPLLPPSASRCALSNSLRVSVRCIACNTDVTSSGCAASSTRSGIGRDTTHWRTGTCEMKSSIRCAAICDIKRASQAGQPKASSLSVLSRHLRLLIQTGARADELNRRALAEGMHKLHPDGIEKMLVGVTTIEEVRRACSSAAPCRGLQFAGFGNPGHCS